MWFKPAFAAPYGMLSVWGRTAPRLDTLMIDPPSPSLMRVPTSAHSRKGPFRFTACTESYIFSVTSTTRS